MTEFEKRKKMAFWLGQATVWLPIAAIAIIAIALS